MEYPFDTVKVRLQSQPDRPPLRYAGPVDCFRQSLHEEGIRGLYRGLSAPLVGAAVEVGSLFFSYRIAQTLWKSAFPIQSADTTAPPLPLPALVTCGAASGAFTSLILTPIELLKCQMQIPLSASSTPHQAPKPLNIIVSIFKHHGLLGFWHGQLGTLIRESGGCAIWFGAYEGVSGLFLTRNLRADPSPSQPQSPPPPLRIWQQMLAGATAGVAYNFSFFPADTIKSRMQTDSVAGNGGGGGGVMGRQTFWASGVSLWQQQGVRGLYRGCGITVARAAPSSAFIFTIYEGLRGAYG